MQVATDLIWEKVTMQTPTTQVKIHQTDESGPGLTDRFSQVRRHTERLIHGLSPEDCQIQSMPDASPAKWHLAHTTWFWETFLLPELDPDYQPFDPQYNFLFNSYYEAVGPRHARPQRGMITRPSLNDVLQYRAHVTNAVLERLSGGQWSDRAGDILALGIAHEEQHQELLVTDIKHALFQNPFGPAYDPAKEDLVAEASEWVSLDGGLVDIGHEGQGFAFDNEGPQHKCWLEPYQIASGLVTNGDVIDFIRDGGYRAASLWLSEGWGRISGEGRQAPFYWHRGEDGDWHHFTLAGFQKVNPKGVARHLDFFEASAIAEWKSARLPTEFEWEHAARHAPDRLSGLFGAVWQWTRSDYAPYPRYQPQPGAIGEYNGKFMSNQYVLRGSSVATSPGHERLSYRNFFPSHAQWQFTGLRLAQDA